MAADGSVVASVKSASGLTAGGKKPSGKIKDCLAEVYFLTLIEATVRRLVLTTPAFFDTFVRDTAGKIAEGIEVACVPLPKAIDNVDLIVRQASEEVSPAAAMAAVAAEVEEEAETDPPGNRARERAGRSGSAGLTVQEQALPGGVLDRG